MQKSGPPSEGHTRLLRKRDDRRGVGEVAGGTAAECAAVCCCCPCAVVKLLVLAVYRVPTGLCRKALLKKKQKKRLMMKKKGLLQPQRTSSSVDSGTMTSSFDESEVGKPAGDDELAAGAMFDVEMWSRLGGFGFWRSPSMEEEGDKSKTV